MTRISTDTGQEFATVEELLAAIRTNIAEQLSPTTNLVVTARATTEMIFNFQALDAYLSAGNQLPYDWFNASTRGDWV
jgi:hypothetical protein